MEVTSQTWSVPRRNDKLNTTKQTKQAETAKQMTAAKSEDNTDYNVKLTKRPTTPQAPDTNAADIIYSKS